jgi:hypothetical protein
MSTTHRGAALDTPADLDPVARLVLVLPNISGDDTEGVLA